MNNLRSLRISIFFIIIVNFTLYILHSAPAAHAQTFSLSLWPPILEVMLQPGKSITQVYEIENNGSEAEKITTQMAILMPRDEQGNAKFIIQDTSPIQFNLENADLDLGQAFNLSPGERKQAVLKVKAPQGCPEQDFYFTFLFSTSPKIEERTLGSREAGVIGGHILLTVSESGKPPKRGKIVEFSTKRITDSLETPEFTLRVQNTGKAFWKPFGAVKVKGLIGQSWEIALRPDNVLASSIRQIYEATPSASPPFLIGPYRATVEFSLNQDGEKLTKTISFLAVPIKVVLAVLIGILLIFAIKTKPASIFRLKGLDKQKIKRNN